MLRLDSIDLIGRKQKKLLHLEFHGNREFLNASNFANKKSFIPNPSCLRK